MLSSVFEKVMHPVQYIKVTFVTAASYAASIFRSFQSKVFGSKCQQRLSHWGLVLMEVSGLIEASRRNGSHGVTL